MDELLEQFLIEAPELVQQASDDLLVLERDPTDAARIGSAFRAVHTLKGSVALFDFAPMSEALHVAEDLLGAVREGRLAAGRGVIDALLDCLGTSESWIEGIARTEHLPDDAPQEGSRLKQMLLAFLRPEGEGPATAAAAPSLDWLAHLIVREGEIIAAQHDAGFTVTALRYVPTPDCFFLGDDPLALVRQIPQLVALHAEAREPWSRALFDSARCNLVFEALSTAPAETIRAIFRFVPDQILLETVAEIAQEAGEAPSLDAAAPFQQERSAAGRSLRVDAARINRLVDIVGELIVAKNGLAHLAAQIAASDPRMGRALAANQAEIDGLVGDLHRTIMGVRMTPLALTFRRFPRMVREIGARLGKEIEFAVRGEEVEADRSIVDGLYEPLLHVLRNAADHGIESRATRLAAGKAPAGRIALDARREGDQIVIEVTDDGAGIDLTKIRATARTSGLLSDEAVTALDDAGVLDLIFLPGLSTAAAVTEVSGRGVGMDAVRTGVEALGGRVSLTSTPGAGSTIRIALPRAVVVTTIMTLLVGEERFGIPIEEVVETTRIPAARILPIGGGEAFVLRDQTIPLLRLAALLDVPAPPRANDDARILIVASGERRIGIEVGGFAERIDVLLRPLTGLLAGMPGLLGAALQGDGRVLMVVDVQELIG